MNSWRHKPLVDLKWYEVEMAAQVGIKRMCSSMALDLKDAHGLDFTKSKLSPVDMAVNSACGELAVAKYLGLFWDGSIDKHGHLKNEPDIGPYQVRTRVFRYSHSIKEPELIFRDTDSPEQIFILAFGYLFAFRIMGWIKGIEAKGLGCREDRGNRNAPAWFVGWRQLKEIEELKEQSINDLLFEQSRKDSA